MQQRVLTENTISENHHETYVPNVLLFKQLTGNGMRHHDCFCVTGLEDSGYDDDPIMKSKSRRIYLRWGLDRFWATGEVH